MLALSLVVLGLLLAAAGLGLSALLGWLRSKGSPPAARTAVHVVVQLAGIALWGVFTATGSVAGAWTAFVVITVGQVFGDLLMLASYRGRLGAAARPGYAAPAADVLSFRRPVAALHALVGAAGWFTMLAACIVASIA